MTIRKLYTGNVVYGTLPKGCRLCLRGLKSVVFVTGICPRRCFYCPISREKRGRDDTYVNERLARDGHLLLAEILTSGSRGAGLTGGDPLVRPKRTLTIIRILKETFGTSFHIHLYTTGYTLTSTMLIELEKAGLDELRLHPDPSHVDSLISLLTGVEISMDVGFEIPMLPDKLNESLTLVRKLSNVSTISFININELEFSEENSLQLTARGYHLASDWKSVRGSREAALKLLETAEREGVNISIHFCPAVVKDRFQTGLRLYRRGILTAKPHELVSDEGTIVKALLVEECERAPIFLTYRGRTGPETSLILAELLGVEHRIVEELPDSSRTLLNIY